MLSQGDLFFCQGLADSAAKGSKGREQVCICERVYGPEEVTNVPKDQHSAPDRRIAAQMAC